MFFKSFVYFLIFSSAVFAHSLKGFDIEVISPSSGVPQSLWDKISKLTGQKLNGSTGTSEDQVFADENSKFKKLNESLRSKHKIIWALRGGYGLDKLMPKVVKSDYSKAKIIIGYSDLTSLMIHLSQKYGWIAINAPMLKDYALANKSEKTYQAIIDLLNGKNKTLKISDLTPMNNKAKSGNISGKITGGNLTCICTTIGTSWQIKTSDRIVLIEDTDVSGYHLDRLLTHMQNVGLFNEAVAIVFGDFGNDVSKILKNFASKIKIPVFISNSFGHGKINLPFIYESNGTIKQTGKNFEMIMKLG